MLLVKFFILIMEILRMERSKFLLIRANKLPFVSKKEAFGLFGSTN
jgi:hypothetical protein